MSVCLRHIRVGVQFQVGVGICKKKKEKNFEHWFNSWLVRVKPKVPKHASDKLLSNFTILNNKLHTEIYIFSTVS